MSKRVGLWIIGAHGGVAITTAVGLAALKLNATGHWGLVSQLPLFQDLKFIDWSQVVLGGHEIRKTQAMQEAIQLAEAAVFSKDLVKQCQAELEAYDGQIRPGVLFNAGKTIEDLDSENFSNRAKSPGEAIKIIQADLKKFVDQNDLERVVVINLASTEPGVNTSELPKTWKELESQLNRSDCVLPASSLYGIAAIQLGFPYINFTPSLGSNLPAIAELAMLSNTCHVGRDGKTGETFLKSVLAPAFGQRNLEIMSWVGHNIFGNRDGVVLNDPINKQTKIQSKDQLLGQILGYQPQTHVSIEYIQSLGDWKTAWDHIHFRGFLGTPMIMTFTWQGCDSILAAPLVLDLFRFTNLSCELKEVGILSHLSSFFKSPMGTTENDFSKQFQLLIEWSERATEKTRSSNSGETSNRV